MCLFLTGCNSDSNDSSKVKKSVKSCSKNANCPMPEAKKKAIVAKLKESGKADDVVKGIENGDIKMYEMNDAVRKKHKVKKSTIALKVGDKIFLDPNAPDSVAAASTAHEGTHVLDKSANKTKADTLRREMKGFNKQADVWESLKKNDPSLTNSQNDNVVDLRKAGKLEGAVKKAYGIP